LINNTFIESSARKGEHSMMRIFIEFYFMNFKEQDIKLHIHIPYEAKRMFTRNCSARQKHIFKLTIQGLRCLDSSTLLLVSSWYC
jgi:hypothetical protein